MDFGIDADDRVAALFILDYGLFRVHSGPRVIGICGFLIQTKKGRNILVDTGFPKKYAEDPLSASLADGLDSFGTVLSLTEDNLPEGQLRLIGLTQDDIDLLILSHTHIDHVGGLHDCPQAPLVIGKAERDLPRPLYFGARQPLDWPDRRTITVDSDVEICLGLTLLMTPGHSPGHLSLLVKLPESGAVLLTADAISRPAEIDEGFAGSWDATQAAASAGRILDLARMHNATIIYGHDPAQWPGLRKAPLAWR